MCVNVAIIFYLLFVKPLLLYYIFLDFLDIKNINVFERNRRVKLPDVWYLTRNNVL